MHNTHSVSFVRRDARPNRIPIGMQGDHLVTTVRFIVEPIDDGMMAFVKLELPDGA